MKHKNIFDARRRQLYYKFEKKKKIYKSIRGNTLLHPYLRFNAQLTLTTFPLNSSKARIKNRCILSGRSRGVESHYKVSRIRFRELAHQGVIPGITQASW